MNEITLIVLGLPSLAILSLLLTIGVCNTLLGVIQAIENKDYDYLKLFLALTVAAIMVGYGIGSMLT